MPGTVIFAEMLFVGQRVGGGKTLTMTGGNTFAACVEKQWSCKHYRYGGIMDYSDLVKEIKRRPITQQGALMIVIIKECIRSKIFKDDDALMRVVQRIINEERA